MMSVAGPNSTVPVSGGAAAASGSAQAQRRTQAAGFSDALRAAAGKYGGAKTESLDDIFSRAAQTYGVPENLLKAVARAESGFESDAVSPCGAEGVMQLMPSTARSLGVSDPFDAEQNIMGGAKYLGGLLSSYGGDEKLALAAYNAGSGNVRKYGGVPPFSETQNYVKRVLSYAGDGSSLTVPVPAQALLAPSASHPLAADAASGDGLFFSMDDYRLFVKMYAEQMVQEALDLAASSSQAEAAGQAQESAGLYRSV